MSARESGPTIAFEGLVEEDNLWLADYLGSEAALEANLPELQELCRFGSLPLRLISAPDAKEAVLDARRQFLVRLGISEISLDRLRDSASQKAYLTQTSTFVRAQRLLCEHGISAEQAVDSYNLTPSTLTWTADAWQTKGEQAKDTDITARAYVLESQEVIVSLIAKNSIALINQTDLMIDDIKIADLAQKAPHLARYTAPTIIRKIAQFKELGFTMESLAQYPHILTCPLSDVTRVASLMEALGIEDAAAVITKAPQILGFAPNSLISKIKALQDSGIDAATAIQTTPKLLLNSHQTVTRRINYISRVSACLGWEGEPKAIIELSPSMLLSSDARLRFMARAAYVGAHTERAQYPVAETAWLFRLPTDAIMLAASDRRLRPRESPKQDIFALAHKVWDESTGTDREVRRQQTIESIKNNQTRHLVQVLTPYYIKSVANADKAKVFQRA